MMCMGFAMSHLVFSLTTIAVSLSVRPFCIAVISNILTFPITDNFAPVRPKVRFFMMAPFRMRGDHCELREADTNLPCYNKYPMPASPP